MNRLSLLLVSLALLTACEPRETPPVRPSPLEGPWSSGVSTSGIGVVVNLVWTPDSVRGTGSYTAFAGSGGCAAANLSGSGTFSFRTRRTSAGAVSGIIAFDSGWRPSYNGPVPDSSHIEGVMTSAGASPCPLTLFRGLVP